LRDNIIRESARHATKVKRRTHDLTMDKPATRRQPDVARKPDGQDPASP
jgi:hypothetical protein